MDCAWKLLTPMLRAMLLSTISSIASQVSRMGTLSVSTVPASSIHQAWAVLDSELGCCSVIKCFVTYRVLTNGWVDVLQRAGEMHQEQVNVSKTPGLILLLGHSQRVLAAVVVVP